MKLSSAEENYSQIDKEALAIVFGVKIFQEYLIGQKFLIKTDHKPLKYLFAPGKNIPVHSNAGSKDGLFSYLDLILIYIILQGIITLLLML